MKAIQILFIISSEFGKENTHFVYLLLLVLNKDLRLMLMTIYRVSRKKRSEVKYLENGLKFHKTLKHMSNIIEGETFFTIFNFLSFSGGGQL